MMLFKGLLQAGAGPAPNYDMQRILSTRTPRDAAKMNGFVNVVLLIPRYMLITGLTVLALAFFSPQLRAMGDGVDFELILPLALKSFVPTGLLGLLIAALLAAFMSNFAATVNAAPAYIVNDIYRKYMRPDADQRTLVRMSYARLGGRRGGRHRDGLLRRLAERPWCSGSCRRSTAATPRPTCSSGTGGGSTLRVLLGHGGRHRRRDGWCPRSCRASRRSTPSRSSSRSRSSAASRARC